MDQANDMPKIERLGHIGLYVLDLNRSLAFYRDLLGLHVTDSVPARGIAFLSARPEEEHHELVLCEGRSVAQNEYLIQQISFRCNSLEDVLAYYRRFKAHEVPIQYTVSHGNAVGAYFYDPDGNICEVYWPTGLSARQGFLQGLDFSQTPEQLMALVSEYVARFGKTGYRDPALAMLQHESKSAPAAEPGTL
jgi:catechol 2,3-dioxygenase-like lactoylglutathione lyase family enzyme